MILSPFFAGCLSPRIYLKLMEKNIFFVPKSIVGKLQN
jgi:hypothetical protein